MPLTIQRKASLFAINDYALLAGIQEQLAACNSTVPGISKDFLENIIYRLAIAKLKLTR